MAKALGNGVPIGALLGARRTSPPRSRPATTPRPSAANRSRRGAALAVLDVMERERVPERAARAGTRLVESLAKLDGVAEVRGAGLLIAAELAPPHDARDDRAEVPRPRPRRERGHAHRAAVRAAAARLRRRDRRRGRPARGGAPMSPHLLEVDDLDPVRLRRILDDAVAWKADPERDPAGARRSSGRRAVPEAVGAHPDLDRDGGRDARRPSDLRPRRGGRCSTCASRSRTSPARWRRCAR